METQEAIKKRQRKNRKFWILLFGSILAFNIIVFYVLHFAIIAATCMTVAQVQADARCLYILNNSIYEKGTRATPHQGHPCGTDVTAIIPAFHLNDPAVYLSPNFVANVCPVVTPTLAPTVTPVPTNKPTATPTLVPTTTITPMPTTIFTVTPVPTQPVPTVSAGVGHTVLSVSACLHGLGRCGDNVSPNAGGNMMPQHQQRQITITVINGNNQIAATQQGMIVYNTTSGNFTGNIDMGTLASGSYLIKEKTNGFLSTQLPGIVQITTAITNTLPLVTEVTGDINNDNQVDVSDYNAILNCYGTKQTTATCINPPNAQSSGADINDDGTVGAIDINLFLREISVQKGG